MNSIVAFRVDGSIKIGTGHIMRCLTLANALHEQGVNTHFICRAHFGHMAEQIKSQGHGVTLLSLNENFRVDDIGNSSSRYASWLGASWIQDAGETKQCLSDMQVSWLIVDHYAIDRKWECSVRNALGIKIMVIDGLADREHDCELLLDQTCSSEGADRWKNLVSAECRLFVGPQYALLRPEFIKSRKTLRQRDGVVRRIIIAFGGVDQHNVTGTVLAAVIELNRADILVDVVVGVANPHRNKLLAQGQNSENVTLHVQAENIAELMTLADLSISGGGTMMWEQCHLGLPSLIVSIAENQRRQSNALHAIGGAVYIGDIGLASKGLIMHNLKRLMSDQNKLKQMQLTLQDITTQPILSVTQFLLLEMQ